MSQNRFLRFSAFVSWVALAGAFFLVRPVLANPAEFRGSWYVDGRDSDDGAYAGKTWVYSFAGASSGWIFVRQTYANGQSRAYWARGTFAGSTLRTSFYRVTKGIVNVLSGTEKKRVRVRGTYVLSGDRVSVTLKADEGTFEAAETWSRKPAEIDLAMDMNGDGRIDGADEGLEEKEFRRIALNDDDDGSPAGFDAGNDVIDGDADRQDLAVLRIRVTGADPTALVRVRAEPAGRVRVFRPDGKVLLAPDSAEAELLVADAAGDFLVEGCSPGEVTLAASLGTGGLTSTDRVKIRVSAEQVYLILFGYQGPEEHYLENDVKRLYRVVDHLAGLGFQVVDDGMGFDQAKLDAALTEESLAKHPRVVIVDRSTTRDDFLKYLDRGTVRGFFWGSHGYMEPWIGCPDEELLTLESRVWSCEPGRPSMNDHRNFVREVKARLEKNVHLDFALLHSCATGGLGTDYWEEPWEYTHADTRTRVESKFGQLPPAEQLAFRTFDLLQPHVSYLVTYNGSSYFGLHDLNLTQVIRSITAVKP